MSQHVSQRKEWECWKRGQKKELKSHLERGGSRGTLELGEKILARFKKSEDKTWHLNKDREKLKRKYRLGERRAMYVSAVLKQKIKASGIKIKIRYDEKIFEEIKMSFGLDKCAVLEIRRGKAVECNYWRPAHWEGWGTGLQIPRHFAVGPDSKYQDKRCNDSRRIALDTRDKTQQTLKVKSHDNQPAHYYNIPWLRQIKRTRLDFR